MTAKGIAQCLFVLGLWLLIVNNAEGQLIAGRDVTKTEGNA